MSLFEVMIMLSNSPYNHITILLFYQPRFILLAISCTTCRPCQHFAGIIIYCLLIWHAYRIYHHMPIKFMTIRLSKNHGNKKFRIDFSFALKHVPETRTGRELGILEKHRNTGLLYVYTKSSNRKLSWIFYTTLKLVAILVWQRDLFQLYIFCLVD